MNSMHGGVGSLREALGADLNPSSEFDRAVVATVAGLLARVDEARADISARGVVVYGRENPACLTERTASAELRGWVKERPDLFGPRVQSQASESTVSLRDKFKVI